MKRWMRRIVSITLAAVMTLGLASAAWASENAHFTFSNLYEEQPDLYVHKTVTSAVDGYSIPEGTEFTFVLKWDQDGDGYTEFAENVIYYVYDETGAQVWNDATSSYIFRTSDTGRFTLQAGQYAYFEWAGEVDYEVWEDENEYPANYIETVPAGGGELTGTVDAAGTMLEFENMYVPDTITEEDTTTLVLQKDISWPSAYAMPDFSDVEFTFQIEIDDEIYANHPYTIYSDTARRNEVGTGTTDKNGCFTLTADQVVEFTGIEIGVDYEITEVGQTGSWRTSGSTNPHGSTTYPIVYSYFTNADADFIVEKVRSDGISGVEDEFTFFLLDESGDPISGASYYLYDSKGNFVDSEDALATGLDGSFTLQAGQRAVFTGIADGTTYTVVEQTADGYVVDRTSGYTQTEDYDEIETLTFTNTQLTNVSVKKYVSGLRDRLLAGAEFTLYVRDYGAGADEDGYSVVETLTTSEEDGSLTFTDLAEGSYKIVETQAPEGYTAYGDDITFDVPLTLTERQVRDSRIDVDSPEFKGLYNSSDGLYYFYQFTYDVYDDMVLLEMPNTGGRAWMIILFAALGGSVALVSVCIFRGKSGRKAKVREHE